MVFSFNIDSCQRINPEPFEVTTPTTGEQLTDNGTQLTTVPTQTNLQTQGTPASTTTPTLTTVPGEKTTPVPTTVVSKKKFKLSKKNCCLQKTDPSVPTHVWSETACNALEYPCCSKTDVDSCSSPQAENSTDAYKFCSFISDPDRTDACVNKQDNSGLVYQDAQQEECYEEEAVNYPCSKEYKKNELSEEETVIPKLAENTGDIISDLFNRLWSMIKSNKLIYFLFWIVVVVLGLYVLSGILYPILSRLRKTGNENYGLTVAY